MKAKKWILLILVLLILGGGGWYIYKITHKPASEEEIPTTDLDKAKVGDVVVLGTYDKDNNAENGEEPLLWKVMAEEDGRLLLATYYGIECLQYNHYPMDITWEECTLRSWLNDEFYNNHFTNEERSKILLSHLENHDNYRWGTDGGNDTEPIHI